jgi:hypothetical protein
MGFVVLALKAFWSQNPTVEAFEGRQRVAKGIKNFMLELRFLLTNH